MEKSCDEAVIRKAEEDIRADDAASLLKRATGRRIIAGTPLAFSEGDPKGRIKNLGKWKKPALWITGTGLILCVVLAVCLLTNRSRQNMDVGAPWYYGSVTAQHDDRFSPYIHVWCNDGQLRVFDYSADNEDIPNDLRGKQVRLRARVNSLTGEWIMTRVEPVSEQPYGTLEEAVQSSVLEHHAYSLDEGEVCCANFITLASEGSGPAAKNKTELVTVYGIVYHQDYYMENGSLMDGSGCNVPTAITFRMNDDGNYFLAEYWEPRDGSYYPEDIRAKFPLFVWPDTQDHQFEQSIAVFDQAMEGLNVGTDVVIDYLIRDICVRDQWADSFASLMEMCRLQRELLVYYGSDTLDFCAREMENKEQDALREQVVNYVYNQVREIIG